MTLPTARWLGSPNFSPNRDGHTMRFEGPNPPLASYVILHTMVGTVAGANARFQQASQQASAHYGVGLDGSLVQWVKESDAAWHAGNYGVNLDSIGIEHEDGGDYNGPRTPQLYATSSQLVADICRRYGIPCTRAYIRKHSEIVPTGCPDALDVNRIVTEAAAILNPAPKPSPAPVPVPAPPANPTPGPAPLPPEPGPLPAPPPAPPASSGVPPVQNPPVPDQPLPPIEPPPVGEPPIVAEQGVTTSEWRMVLGYLTQLAGVATVAVFTKVTAAICPLVASAATCASYHPTIPPDLLQLIVPLEVAGAIGAAGYAISRGVRKLGAR